MHHFFLVWLLSLCFVVSFSFFFFLRKKVFHKWESPGVCGYIYKVKSSKVLFRGDMVYFKVVLSKVIFLWYEEDHIHRGKKNYLDTSLCIAYEKVQPSCPSHSSILCDKLLLHSLERKWMSCQKQKIVQFIWFCRKLSINFKFYEW